MKDKDVAQTLIRSLTAILVVILAAVALFAFFDPWRLSRLNRGGSSGSPNSQDTPANPEAAAPGDRLYAGACQGCHGNLDFRSVLRPSCPTSYAKRKTRNTNLGSLVPQSIKSYYQTTSNSRIQQGFSAPLRA